MSRSLLLLPVVLLLLTGCKTAKMMEALNLHRSAILEASSDQMAPKQKLDIIGNTFAAVMDESLSYGSVKKSVKHVDKFSKQNSKELDQIFGDISTWVEGMNKNEKRKFLLGLATKRYTLDIIRLIPKVEKKVQRRISTFLFFNKLVKLIKPENLLKGL